MRGPNYEKRFYIQTDASTQGIAAILSQKDDDGTDHPVAYYSRKLSPSEKNYFAMELECLSVVRGIEHFQIYLTGVPFTVETDHACLQYLANRKEKKGRLTRWALRLQEFDFQVQHRPGKKNGNADGLSRQAWSPDPNPEGPLHPSRATETEDEDLYFTPEGGRGEC